VSTGFAGTLRSAAIFAVQKRRSPRAGIDGWIFSGATAAPRALRLRAGRVLGDLDVHHAGLVELRLDARRLAGHDVPRPISSRLFLRTT
jgi:hypothetical protein